MACSPDYEVLKMQSVFHIAPQRHRCFYDGGPLPSVVVPPPPEKAIAPRGCRAHLQNTADNPQSLGVPPRLGPRGGASLFQLQEARGLHQIVENRSVPWSEQEKIGQFLVMRLSCMPPRTRKKEEPEAAKQRQGKPRRGNYSILFPEGKCLPWNFGNAIWFSLFMVSIQKKEKGSVFFAGKQGLMVLSIHNPAVSS